MPGLEPGFVWSLVVSQLLPCPATCPHGVGTGLHQHVLWLWWSRVLLLFPCCVAWPALSPLQLCHCQHWAHPTIVASPMFLTRTGLRPKLLWGTKCHVSVLLLPSDMECFRPGKHPHDPLAVGKGMWGCWDSLPGNWPRATAGGMDVPGACFSFPWGFGNRCSEGYLRSSISCALCDGCLWNSSLQVLGCSYCNMPWAFTVKNLLENLGICI